MTPATTQQHEARIKKTPQFTHLGQAIDNIFALHGVAVHRKPAAKNAKAQSPMQLGTLAQMDDQVERLAHLKAETKRQEKSCKDERDELKGEAAGMC